MGFCAPLVDLYSAQRTNFAPSVPRLATEAGQQRQVKKRSRNRGKADPVEQMKENQRMLLDLAKFKASGVA